MPYTWIQIVQNQKLYMRNLYTMLMQRCNSGPEELGAAIQ